MFRQPAVPSLSPLEAADLLGQEPGQNGPARRALLVDVRERNEFGDVRAPGAVLYPISTLMYRFQELPRDRPLLVICAHGERSQGATAFLLRQGFDDVRSVTGGLAEWLRAGLPHRRGAPAAGEGLLDPDRA